MKKFLVNITSLMLILVCCFAVGCSNKEQVSKRAINACKNYLTDLERLDETISSSAYVYPADEAKSIARQVEDSDESQFGIKYLNYNNFEFDSDANGHSLFAPKILYPGAIGVLSHLDRYVDYLNEDNFKLDTTYKFAYQDGDEFCRVNFSNNTVYIYIERPNYYTQYTIEIANNKSTDWKNVEKREIAFNNSGDVTYYQYYYIEKSTNENRILDRCANIIWSIKSASANKDQIISIDFEETTQKMLFVDEAFYPESVTGVVKSLRDYMLTLDFEEFVNIIDKTNSVKIAIN